MRIKRKNGLKIAAITIALLLCLALAVGITGAWYQAKRQATGTLSMDQGIIIDYKGFNGSETGATWERGTTFELFSTKAGKVQPGAHIKVNPASIKANAKSVNFYARVRLEYKFYNGEVEVTLEDPTVLIKASNLFGSNWEFSSMAAPKDYYYYVENGTTTFKTMEAGADFVELIQSNAEFIIEGEGFVGADNNGASGGFVVDETTSINKIVVNLVLETLQGDADPATEDWKLTGSSDDPTEVIEDFVSNDLRNSSGNILDSTSTDLIENTSYQVVDKSGNGYQFTYYLNSETKTISITGTVGSPTKIDIPSKIVVGGTEYFVNLISTSAFRYSRSLTSVTISEGMTEISASAFQGCTKLTSITLPDSIAKIGEHAFDECSSLISINIPKSLTEIAYYAFYHCSSLQSLIIPDNIKTIAICAFAGCSGLTSVTIGNGVTTIKENAFSRCTSLSSLTIPVNVTSIEKDAFTACSGLNSIKVADGNSKYFSTNNCLIETASKTLILGCKTSVIPEDESIVTMIGYEAFAYQTDLKLITIPGNIINIGASAFRDTGLNSVTLSNNIQSLNDYIFAYCKNLKTIVIPDSITNIGNNVFQGCSNLQSITLPNSIQNIGESMFNDCTSLTSITIPNSVTNIGRWAFCNCSSLTKIELSESVINIQERAFQGCSSLTEIVIPSSVTDIASYAFNNCNNLTTQIGDGWVRTRDNTAVDAKTLLKDIGYDAIKRA